MHKSLFTSTLRSGLVGLLAVACIATPCSAQERKNPEKLACETDISAAEDTHQMMVCARRRLEVADANLNFVYVEYRKALQRPEQQLALLKAQRAWIAWRDSEADAQALASWTRDAEMYAFEHAETSTRLTQQRAVELKALILALSRPEGNR